MSSAEEVATTTTGSTPVTETKSEESLVLQNDGLVPQATDITTTPPSHLNQESSLPQPTESAEALSTPLTQTNQQVEEAKEQIQSSPSSSTKSSKLKLGGSASKNSSSSSALLPTKSKSLRYDTKSATQSHANSSAVSRVNTQRHPQPHRRELSPLQKKLAIREQKRRQRHEEAERLLFSNKLKDGLEIRPDFDSSFPVLSPLKAHGRFLQPLGERPPSANTSVRPKTGTLTAHINAPSSPSGKSAHGRSTSMPMSPTPLVFDTTELISKPVDSSGSPSRSNSPARQIPKSVWDDIPTIQRPYEEKEDWSEVPIEPHGTVKKVVTISTVHSQSHYSPRKPPSTSLPLEARGQFGPNTQKRNTGVSPSEGKTGSKSHTFSMYTSKSDAELLKSLHLEMKRQKAKQQQQLKKLSATPSTTSNKRSSQPESPSNAFLSIEHNEVAETGKLIRSRRSSLTSDPTPVLSGNDAIIVESKERERRPSVRVGGALLLPEDINAKPRSRRSSLTLSNTPSSVSSPTAAAPADGEAMFHFDTPRGSKKLHAVSPEAEIKVLQSASPSPSNANKQSSPSHQSNLSSSASTTFLTGVPEDQDDSPRPEVLTFDDHEDAHDFKSNSSFFDSSFTNSTSTSPDKIYRRKRRPLPEIHIRMMHQLSREEKLARASTFINPIQLPISNPDCPSLAEYEASQSLLSAKGSKAARAVILPPPREYQRLTGLLRQGALDIYAADEATLQAMRRKREAKRKKLNEMGARAIATKLAHEQTRKERWAQQEAEREAKMEKREQYGQGARAKVIAADAQLALESRLREEKRLEELERKRQAELQKKRNEEIERQLKELAKAFQDTTILKGELLETFTAKGHKVEWLHVFQFEVKEKYNMRHLITIISTIADMQTSGMTASTYSELIKKLLEQCDQNRLHRRVKSQQSRDAHTAVLAQASAVEQDLSSLSTPDLQLSPTATTATPVKKKPPPSSSSTAKKEYAAMSMEELAGLMNDLNACGIEVTSFAQLQTCLASKATIKKLEAYQGKQSSSDSIPTSGVSSPKAKLSRPPSHLAKAPVDQQQAEAVIAATVAARTSRRPSITSSNNKSSSSSNPVKISVEPASGVLVEATPGVLASHPSNSSTTPPSLSRPLSHLNDIPEAVALHQQITQLMAVEDYQAAVPLAEQELQIREEVYQSTIDVRLLPSLEQCASLYEILQQPGDALPFLFQFLQIVTSVHGRNHHVVADSLMRMGEALVALQEGEDAFNVFTRCYLIRRDTLGRSHPKTVKARTCVICLTDENFAIDELSLDSVPLLAGEDDSIAGAHGVGVAGGQDHLLSPDETDVVNLAESEAMELAERTEHVKEERKKARLAEEANSGHVPPPLTRMMSKSKDKKEKKAKLDKNVKKEPKKKNKKSMDLSSTEAGPAKKGQPSRSPSSKSVRAKKESQSQQQVPSSSAKTDDNNAKRSTGPSSGASAIVANEIVVSTAIAPVQPPVQPAPNSVQVSTNSKQEQQPTPQPVQPTPSSAAPSPAVIESIPPSEHKETTVASSVPTAIAITSGTTPVSAATPVTTSTSAQVVPITSVTVVEEEAVKKLAARVAAEEAVQLEANEQARRAAEQAATKQRVEEEAAAAAATSKAAELKAQEDARKVKEEAERKMAQEAAAEKQRLDEEEKKRLAAATALKVEEERKAAAKAEAQRVAALEAAENQRRREEEEKRLVAESKAKAEQKAKEEAEEAAASLKREQEEHEQQRIQAEQARAREAELAAEAERKRLEAEALAKREAELRAMEEAVRLAAEKKKEAERKRVELEAAAKAAAAAAQAEREAKAAAQAAGITTPTTPTAALNRRPTFDQRQSLSGLPESAILTLDVEDDARPGTANSELISPTAGSYATLTAEEMAAKLARKAERAAIRAAKAEKKERKLERQKSQLERLPSVHEDGGAILPAPNSPLSALSPTTPTGASSLQHGDQEFKEPQTPSSMASNGSVDGVDSLPGSPTYGSSSPPPMLSPEELAAKLARKAERAALRAAKAEKREKKAAKKAALERQKSLEQSDGNSRLGGRSITRLPSVNEVNEVDQEDLTDTAEPEAEAEA